MIVRHLVLLDPDFNNFSVHLESVLRAILGPENVTHFPLQPGSVTPPLAAFETLSAELEEYYIHGLRVVWVPQGESGKAFKPGLMNQDGFIGTCAALALAYPDLDFIPVAKLQDILTAVPQVQGGMDPLTDPWGRREGIRDKLRAMKDEKGDLVFSYLPKRKKLTVAIDDEEIYAHLHAYAAYRFGNRSMGISCWNQAQQWLGKDSVGFLRINIDQTFEDLFMHFPDGACEGLSDLAQRDQTLPRLAEAKIRNFVSSAFRQSGYEERQERNRAHLLDWAKEPGENRAFGRLSKPYGGIHALWKNLNLEMGWTSVADSSKLTVSSFERKIPHSAPGVVAKIAQTLIDRSGAIVRSNPGLLEAIRGAVLATEALELIGGLNPTYSIEALRLRHECEAIAECSFSGVEYNISTKERIDEIYRDAESISHHFGPNHAKRAGLNAAMNILNRILVIMRNNAQFDEEQDYLAEIRKKHHALKWMDDRRPDLDSFRKAGTGICNKLKTHSIGQKYASEIHKSFLSVWWILSISKRTLRELERPLDWYGETALASAGKLLCLILGQWILITFLFYFCLPSGRSGLGYAIECTISTFVSIGQPIVHGEGFNTLSVGFVVVNCYSMIMGWLHLGFLIANIYQVLSRK